MKFMFPASVPTPQIFMYTLVILLFYECFFYLENFQKFLKKDSLGNFEHYVSSLKKIIAYSFQIIQNNV